MRRAIPLSDVLLAWLIATLFSGIPSTAYALLTGSDPWEATHAAAAMLTSSEASSLSEIVARAAVVHSAVSLFWTLVLACVLPRRRVMAWAVLASAAIALLTCGS